MWDFRTTLSRRIITLAIGFVLALSGASLAYSTPPAMNQKFDGAVFFIQSTATPQPKDISEIGSTDAIVLMGVLIALIVIIPILLQRKAWMEPR
jgi:hypothetical protein